MPPASASPPRCSNGRLSIKSDTPGTAMTYTAALSLDAAPNTTAAPTHATIGRQHSGRPAGADRHRAAERPGRPQGRRLRSVRQRPHRALHHHRRRSRHGRHRHQPDGDDQRAGPALPRFGRPRPDRQRPAGPDRRARSASSWRPRPRFRSHPRCRIRRRTPVQRASGADGFGLGLAALLDRDRRQAVGQSTPSAPTRWRSRS